MAGPTVDRPDDEQALGALPSVDQLLRAPDAVALLATQPRWAVVAAVRAGLERRRQAILDGNLAAPTDLADAVRALLRPSLRPVLNATGVVLHTNLGRAPLAEAAIERLAATARGYVNLEYVVDERRRGSRHDHVRELLTTLTGAEDALVVNNCAAAVMLALGAHAAGRKAVVSRGELVEIGGSFRVPDVMRASGVTLVEVGTTNRTHPADYEQVLDDVALVCKVHRSNFVVAGFVAEVAVDALAALAHRRQRLLFVDLGSGALRTPSSLGLDADTPTVSSVVAAGADLVAFSGDKLLGGPQAGILVGTTAALLPLRSHPLLRAVRPSRLTLAALEGHTRALSRRPHRRAAGLGHVVDNGAGAQDARRGAVRVGPGSAPVSSAVCRRWRRLAAV